MAQRIRHWSGKPGVVRSNLSGGEEGSVFWEREAVGWKSSWKRRLRCWREVINNHSIMYCTISSHFFLSKLIDNFHNSYVFGLCNKSHYSSTKNLIDFNGKSYQQVNVKIKTEFAKIIDENCKNCNIKLVKFIYRWS